MCEFIGWGVFLNIIIKSVLGVLSKVIFEVHFRVNTNELDSEGEERILGREDNGSQSTEG